MKVNIGENGYIHETKKFHLKRAGVYSGLVVIIFVSSEILVNDFALYLRVLSALMILPASLFLAKYFTFSPYKSNLIEEYNRIKAIDMDGLFYSELVIVRNKSTLFYEYILINNGNIFVYKKGSNKEKEHQEYEMLLKEILKSKGLTANVTIIGGSFEGFYNLVKRGVARVTIANNIEKDRIIGKAILDHAL